MTYFSKAYMCRCLITLHYLLGVINLSDNDMIYISKITFNRVLSQNTLGDVHLIKPSTFIIHTQRT